jgi:hypothetical protein
MTDTNEPPDPMHTGSNNQEMAPFWRNFMAAAATSWSDLPEL